MVITPGSILDGEIDDVKVLHILFLQENIPLTNPTKKGSNFRPTSNYILRCRFSFLKSVTAQDFAVLGDLPVSNLDVIIFWAKLTDVLLKKGPRFIIHTVLIFPPAPLRKEGQNEAFNWTHVCRTLIFSI
jgi:hypothetical protein